MVESDIYETIIVGAGIAGCTAAIYAARKKMKYLFLTEKFGGQFMESGEVLNYPGIVKITGVEFSNKMEEQLKFNSVKPQIGVKVSKIVKKGKNYLVKTNKKNYLTKTIILSTGSHPRKLGVIGEDKFKNKGVTYCAICDGPVFAKKNVVVVGGGNSALEAVDFVLNVAKKIYVVNINKKFNAHQYLIDKIKKHPKVTILNKAKTIEIVGDNFVKGLKYEQDGQTKELKVEGVFVEIGRIPNVDFVKGLLELDEHNHILVDCNTQTSLPGIFAAGDCSSVHEYQYVISAGSACVALLKAAKYISTRKN